LTGAVLPGLRKGQPERVSHILSLPCATGEEPFSIAMALLDAGFAAGGFQIDACDISLRAIAFAQAATYLSVLPKTFPAAIVIIQHVDEQFAPGMADWLSGNSQLPVRVAKEGDRPAAGTALLAGTNDHLVFKTSGRLGYSGEPRDLPYRPSVDVFFESLSELWPGDAVGVLLTGMGRDGAQGLKRMRNKGHYTIAQDEATSAVYGMPKAAATLGAAVDILPVDRIAQRLVEIFSY